MDHDSEHDHLIDRRMEALLHRARRIVLEIFGPEAAAHHPVMTVQIAATLATLEATEAARVTAPRKDD